MRTQKQNVNTAHLSNSKRIFELLLNKVRTFDKKAEAECIKNRDYEELERLVLEHLMASDTRSGVDAWRRGAGCVGRISHRPL